MELETREEESWRWSLIIALGVIGTVLVALLLAQVDTLQRPLRPSPPPVIANATIIAITRTPLPAIPLLSATPSPTLPPTPIPTTTSPLPEECGFIPAGWQPTTVQPGESLLTLAIRSGSSEAEIVRANCLVMGSLEPGMIIYLPPAPPTRQACGPPRHWVQVVVQPGDTMFALATTRGTTLAEIIRANCLSDTSLYAGQVIFLPPLVVTATAVPTDTPTDTPTEPPSATPHPPTNTPEPSPTAVTPSATVTPTPSTTPTAVTPTVTPSTTPTFTPSATATETAVPATDTPSPTPTETATPTDTPLPPTDTPIPPTPTDTPAPVPSATS